MNYKLVLQKFIKGAVFGAGSALFSIDISSIGLSSVTAYKKLGIIAVAAIIAGGLHGIWEVGKQMFTPPPQE